MGPTKLTNKSDRVYHLMSNQMLKHLMFFNTKTRITKTFAPLITDSLKVERVTEHG